MPKVGALWLGPCAMRVVVPAQTEHDGGAHGDHGLATAPRPRCATQATRGPHVSVCFILSATLGPRTHTQESRPGRTGLSPTIFSTGSSGLTSSWALKGPARRPRVMVVEDWGPRWPRLPCSRSL